MSEDRRRSVDLVRSRPISRDLPRSPVDLTRSDSLQIRTKFGTRGDPPRETAGPSPGHRRYLRSSRKRHVTRTLGYSAASHSPSLATESGVDAHRCAARIQNAASGPICRPRPCEPRGPPMTKRGAHACRDAPPSAYAYPTCSATARQECRLDNTARRHARTCDSTLPVTGTGIRVVCTVDGIHDPAYSIVKLISRRRKAPIVYRVLMRGTPRNFGTLALPHTTFIYWRSCP